MESRNFVAMATLWICGLPVYPWTARNPFRKWEELTFQRCVRVGELVVQSPRATNSVMVWAPLKFVFQAVLRDETSSRIGGCPTGVDNDTGS